MHNQEHRENVSLVQAKRDECITSLDVTNYKDYFESVIMKQKKVFVTMLRFNHNTHIKNRPIYKEKWDTIYDDYKRLEIG